MTDHDEALKCLEQCHKGETPYFGEAGELFRGIKESHGVLFALAGLLSRSGINTLKCLEIGSFAGASAVTWAWSINRHFGGDGSVTCLDPWDEFPHHSNGPINPHYSQSYMATIH